MLSKMQNSIFGTVVIINDVIAQTDVENPRQDLTIHQASIALLTPHAQTHPVHNKFFPVPAENVVNL